MGMVFKKIQSKARLLNPFKDFSLDEIPFEIRYDPLTKETGRVYDLPYAPPPITDLKETIKRSKEVFCPFCPEVLEKSTTLFTKDFIPEGRIKIGQATLIPNLIPFDTYAGVSILSTEHHIGIENLTPETMKDAFSACLSFVKHVVDFDPRVQFFYINWNYMPESGSSLVHPHLQVNCGYIPTNHHRRQIEGCKSYLSKKGSSFWNDYIASEKRSGKRYIGEKGPTFWAMSFLPLTFLPDVWCIFPEHHSLLQLGGEELGAFLQGLSKIIQYFGKENIPSFNMSLFSHKEDTDFRINAKICPRLHPRPIGNSDRAYLQLIHRESYTIRPPEAACQKVKKIFNA